jgi:hypothetical protein
VDDKSDAAMAKRELDRYLHYYSRYHAHGELVGHNITFISNSLVYSFPCACAVLVLY